MSDLNELLDEPAPDVSLPNLDELWAKGRKQRRNRNLGRGIAGAAVIGLFGIGGMAIAGNGDEATRIDGTASAVSDTVDEQTARVFVRPTVSSENPVVAVFAEGVVSEWVRVDNPVPLTVATRDYTIVFMHDFNFKLDTKQALQTFGDFAWLEVPPLNDGDTPYTMVLYNDGEAVVQLIDATSEQSRAFVEGLQVVNADTFAAWTDDIATDTQYQQLPPPAANDSDAPTLRDHWHVAFGVNDCGEFAPDHLSNDDPVGIHTHNDGLIHIHPFSSEATGSNATLGLYADSVSDADRLDELAERSSCVLDDGTEVEAEFKVVRWANADDIDPIEVSNTWRDVRFIDDGGVIVAALVPVGEDVPKPPSMTALSQALGN